LNKFQTTLAVIVLGINMILFASCRNNVKDEIIMKTVYNFNVEHKEIDRELTRESFHDIKYGSSLIEIEEIFGEPNGWLGTGVLAPYYSLEDKEYAILRFKNPFISEDLKSIELVNDTIILEEIRLAVQ